MPRGRPPKVTDRELFDGLRQIPGPAFGAGEVAAELDGEIQTPRCRERLDDLVEEGLLGKKEIGGMNVYWIQSPPESPSPEAA